MPYSVFCMSKIQYFYQLNTWKEAHKLVLLIYKLTNKFPKSEQFGLTNQMRRAVISVSSNIAEGFGRKSKKDKQYFYNISITSLTEIQDQLIISKDLIFITKQEYIEAFQQTLVVKKLTSGLYKSAQDK